MSIKRKAAVRQALKCCGQEEKDCNNCPYLGGACDMPFVEFVMLPVHLLKDISAEMFEPDSVWENDPEYQVQ